MIISNCQGAQRKIEDTEDTLYDLSYDDMDTFVRSCGVILPEPGLSQAL